MTDFNLFSIGRGVFESIYNLIKTFVVSRLNTFVDFFLFLVPDTSPYLPFLQNLFNMVQDFCLYILDASMINSSVFLYLIGSLTFKISSKLIVYLIKVIVKWWDMIFI